MLLIRLRTSDGREVPGDAQAGYIRFGTPRLRKPAKDGTFPFTDAPVGRLDVTAQAAGWVADTVPVNLVPGVAAEAIVTLTAAGAPKEPDAEVAAGRPTGLPVGRTRGDNRGVVGLGWRRHGACDRSRGSRVLTRGLTLGASLLLAACGGGGSSSSGAVDLGGPTGTGGFTGVVTTRSAVVSLDVDGDALPDLVAVGRDGSGAGAAWRNLGRGAWAAAPSTWRDGPVVGALVDDTERRDDATLAQGYAVHPLERVGHAPIPYSVLHLGDGAGAALGAPVLDAIEPTSGSTHQLVRLEGSALASAGVATTVTFGSASATVLFAFPDLVLAVVPEGLPLGTTDVRVARGDVVSAPISFEVTRPRRRS